MEFPGGEGGLSWETILENPEGGGVIRKIPSVGGMDIFWNHTLLIVSFQSAKYFFSIA